jgi:hypothetical protein
MKIKLCVLCGCEYGIKRDNKKRPRKYCSQKCSNIANGESRKGINFREGQPAWNKGVSMPEETKRKISEAKKGQHCSPKTEFKKGHDLSKGRIVSYEERLKNSKTRRERRETYKSWKGGITPEIKMIRQCFKNKIWKESVLERDNSTCVLCGSAEKEMDADHYPKLFAEILKEHKIETLDEALNCNDLWDVNNGRTLCKKCHRENYKKITGFINAGSFKKNMTPWNKGGKGSVAWNKGIKATDEHRKKLSEVHKGQVAWNKGKKSSEECRRKMSEIRKEKPLGTKVKKTKTIANTTMVELV